MKLKTAIKVTCINKNIQVLNNKFVKIYKLIINSLDSMFFFFLLSFFLSSLSHSSSFNSTQFTLISTQFNFNLSHNDS